MLENQKELLGKPFGSQVNQGLNGVNNAITWSGNHHKLEDSTTNVFGLLHLLEMLKTWFRHKLITLTFTESGAVAVDCDL